MKNKYEQLSDLINQVLTKLVNQKNLLETDQSWIKKERNNINKSLGDIEDKIEELDYVSYVLENFKTILIDILKEEFLVPGAIVMTILMIILSFLFNAFNNPVMFLAALGISLGMTLVGAGIDFRIEANEALKIKKNHNLSDVLIEKSDLQKALEIKRSDFQSIVHAEQKTAERLARVNSDYKTFKGKAECVYAARIVAEHKCRGNIEEINKVFTEDQESMDIMRLTREKLEIKPEQ